MMNRRRFITVVAAACIGGGQTQASPLRWSGRAMGAEVSLELHGGSPVVLAAARAAILRLEQIFSLHDPRSELSRLNANGGGIASPDMVAVLDLAEEVHGETGGLFDPTIQPVFEAWLAGEAAPWHRVGWQRIHRKGHEVRFGKGQALTLNGIAQGYATDRVRAVLMEHGLTLALVAVGEHAAIGGPFRLALVDPVHGRIGTRTLQNGAIATSSPFAMRLGKGTHIIAPNGSETPRWSTVSVEAQSAALADALSTALCLAPVDMVRDVARVFGVRVTLVDAGGDVLRVGP